MHFKQKLTYMALGGLLTFFESVVWTTDPVTGENTYEQAAE